MKAKAPRTAVEVWPVIMQYRREPVALILSRQVLPTRVSARVSVEQASEFGWERHVGSAGRMIGMNTFGASAPLKELQTRFGFTPERILEAAREQVRVVRESRKEESQ